MFCLLFGSLLLLVGRGSTSGPTVAVQDVLFLIILITMSRVHRAGCPLRRRRRREDTLGALDGLAGVGEGCVVRSVPSRRGLAVARAAPSVPAILWLAAHPRRRLQAARFATRAATRTAKGSRGAPKSVGTRQAAQRGGGLDTRAPGAQGLSAAARTNGERSRKQSNFSLIYE